MCRDSYLVPPSHSSWGPYPVKCRLHAAYGVWEWKSQWRQKFHSIPAFCQATKKAEEHESWDWWDRDLGEPGFTAWVNEGEKNAGICPATRRCFSLNVLSWPATFFLPENYSAFFQTSLQSPNSCILSFIVAECLPDSEKSLLPSGRRCSITNVSSWFSLHVGHVLLIVLSPALGS